MTNVLFIELQSALSDGSAFDALVSGTYTDMMGREIEFKADGLQDFVSNTRLAIEATRTEGGEVVGLPIDARDHDKGDGAGWIIGIELSNGIVRVIPKWTDIGRDLISRGVRRFFSATVDMANKVILGGTLTNWPATRDKQGRIQLRPIELEVANSLCEIVSIDDSPGALDMAKEKEPVIEPVEAVPAIDEAELREQIRAELIAEFKDGDTTPVDLSQAREALMAQMKEEVQADVTRMIAGMRRDQHIAEFSQQVVSGTAARPYGLPVGQEEVETVLLSLNDEQRAAVESILSRVHEQGLVQFSEIGHGKTLTGVVEFPLEFSASLTSWLDDGNTRKEFFAINPELGGEAQYNLDDYEEAK